MNYRPGLPTPPRLRFAEPPLLEKEGKFFVGMINDASNQSVLSKTLLHRFVPLTKGDSPEPSGQGVYVINSTFNIFFHASM